MIGSSLRAAMFFLKNSLAFFGVLARIVLAGLGFSMIFRIDSQRLSKFKEKGL
jgi:hypothetical protein